MPFEADPLKDVSYINLTLLDASRAIETGVKDKLKEKTDSIRFPMARKILKRDKAQDRLASFAAKTVKPAMLAKELSKMMPKLMMYMMHQKIGMKIAAKTIFVEDAYLVVEFQIKYVDTQKLLAKVQETAESGETPDDLDDEELPEKEVIEAWIEEMKAEAAADPSEIDSSVERSASTSSTASNSPQTWTGWIAGHMEYMTTDLLPTRYKESLENDSLPNTVQTKITDMMGGMMEKKLAEKELEAEIAVLNSESQARYFFTNLEAVRERAKADKA